MPSVTYVIRFTHYNSTEIEEQEHVSAESAWTAFRLFIEPDSLDVYRRIELIERNWKEHLDYPLAEVSFSGC